MPAINQSQTLSNEVVLSERVATTEFKVTEIQESIINRYVRAEVELGPFVNVAQPDQPPVYRGSSRRGITVWENDEYDVVRDTWANADLLAVVTAKLG